MKTKTTLLILTGVACLATAGVAMVAADRPAASSFEASGYGASNFEISDFETSDFEDSHLEASGGEAEVIADNNEGTRLNVRQQGGNRFQLLDTRQGRFLSANELPAYTTFNQQQSARK